MSDSISSAAYFYGSLLLGLFLLMVIAWAIDRKRNTGSFRFPKKDLVTVIKIFALTVGFIVVLTTVKAGLWLMSRWFN